MEFSDVIKNRYSCKKFSSEQIGKDKLNNDSTLQITGLEELRKEYKVSIEDSTLKDQYETYLKNAKKQASSNTNK